MEGKHMNHSDVLKAASDIISGDRAKDYGDPYESFAAIAQMWSAYLSVQIEPRDVANMMALLKICRLRRKPHDDSSIDGCAYLALASQMEE